MRNTDINPREVAKVSTKKHLTKTNGNDIFFENLERHVKACETHTSGSSRKNQVLINHLLEFSSYRDSPEYHQIRQKPRRMFSKKPQNYKKKLHLQGMRFINVNYKFVVDCRKQYKMQQVDPDVPVDTSDIIRIIVPKGNACPICLSKDFVAPRMVTSCGHILCLTCLLSLLESEVPKDMKKESEVIVEKYNDCPLCGSIIRKSDVKPVKIDNVDERFETPKVGDEVVFSLMTRSADSAVPISICFRQSVSHDSFPEFSQTFPEQSQYSRIFKGDLACLTKMYNQDKEDLNQAYMHDKEVYGDDGRFFNLALKSIDNDMAEWTAKFLSDLEIDSYVDTEKSQSKIKQQTFYYYQTGFKTSTTYVLSPLDMRVLKTSFNFDYTQLPNSVIAKVENIRYEELDSETVAARYKYLSHLPSGTSIGFLECNWQANEFISRMSWETFETSLEKRTKASAKKLRKEELSRRRALHEEERRANEYIKRENNGDAYDHCCDKVSWVDSAQLGSLKINNRCDLPLLSKKILVPDSGDSVFDTEKKYELPELRRSVWGMQIPKSQNHKEEEDDVWNADEIIRKAREEFARQEAVNGKGKKKKNKILLSS